MSKGSDPVTEIGECIKSEPFSFHVVTNENSVYFVRIRVVIVSMKYEPLFYNRNNKALN